MQSNAARRSAKPATAAECIVALQQPSKLETIPYRAHVHKKDVDREKECHARPASPNEPLAGARGLTKHVHKVPTLQYLISSLDPCPAPRTCISTRPAAHPMAFKDKSARTCLCKLMTISACRASLRHASPIKRKRRMFLATPSHVFKSSGSRSRTPPNTFSELLPSESHQTLPTYINPQNKDHRKTMCVCYIPAELR
nr:hypothetical protein CFP56_09199 [Quercus suber]